MNPDLRLKCRYADWLERLFFICYTPCEDAGPLRRAVGACEEEDEKEKFRDLVDGRGAVK